MDLDTQTWNETGSREVDQKEQVDSHNQVATLNLHKSIIFIELLGLFINIDR